MSLDAVADGGVVALEESGNLGDAVVSVGMLLDEPPKLLAGSADALGAIMTADVVNQDATATADLLEHEQQVMGVQSSKHGVGGAVGCHRVYLLRVPVAAFFGGGWAKASR